MGKITRAMLLASLILVSSAIFLSQADRIAGKAQSAAITGTMVLFDQGNTQGIKTTLWFSNIYLPSSTCTAYANYCFGDGTAGNSKCVTKQISNSSGNKFAIDLRPGTILGSGGSCGSTYTKTTASSYVYATCSATGSNTAVATASVNILTKTLLVCSPPYASGPFETSYHSNTATDFGAAKDTVYTASCTGTGAAYTAITEYSGDLPQPLGHLEVTYECQV